MAGPDSPPRVPLALKLALAPLLLAQAVHTRRRLPRLPEAAGAREGVVGRGAELDLLIVGDSSAAGVGVDTQDDALAGCLSRALARHAGRRAVPPGGGRRVCARAATQQTDQQIEPILGTCT